MKNATPTETATVQPATEESSAPQPAPWETPKCPNCESGRLTWSLGVKNYGDVQDGRIRLSEAGVIAYLGCDECSETIKVIDGEAFTQMFDTLECQRDQAVMENQDFLDTFQAIYAALGLTQENVKGDEKVSVTVARAVATANADRVRLREESKSLQDFLINEIIPIIKIEAQKPEKLGGTNWKRLVNWVETEVEKHALPTPPPPSARETDYRAGWDDALDHAGCPSAPPLEEALRRHLAKH